ncbi:MAG: hypothetical protein GTO26_12585, partial [Planctomycetales bacterium]|nr:hypothetical protein [Planctomycetales bacterium]NIO35771.1 hypothetical protein [Planctomycetales bacterium]NIO47523.1 hypothetical protein [Planctomycetales bacterium]
ALGMPAGKPEASQHTPCWDYLFHMMDENKNRSVTRAEFTQYWARQFAGDDANQDGLLNPDEFQPPVIFNYVDANRDGQITLGEYQRIYPTHFDRRDQNQDDVLVAEELRTHR